MNIEINGVLFKASSDGDYTYVEWTNDYGSVISTFYQESYEGAITELLFDHIVRPKRDELIAETDWRATVDYPNGDQQAWLNYRRQLRDLTKDYVFGNNIEFPEEPRE